jgi:two-component system phosphate regulon response regulator PhoB
MGSNAPKRVVAIADPFPDEAELYHMAFGSSGFALHALPTHDAELAARSVLDAGAHLVVTRILPGKFGISLVRALRRETKTAQIPVLVVTTYPSPALHAEAREAGADDVLLLPVDPDELVERARHLRPRRQKLTEAS